REPGPGYLPGSYEHPRGAREARCGVQTNGRSRRLADDGRHFTDPAVRFAGIFVGIVNAAPVVIFSVAQHPAYARLRPTTLPVCGLRAASSAAWCSRREDTSSIVRGGPGGERPGPPQRLGSRPL